MVTEHISLGTGTKSIYHIRHYIASLNITNLSIERRQINYDIGVPFKYLTDEILNNSEKLIKICEEHKQFPSELEIGIDEETNELLDLK